MHEVRRQARLETLGPESGFDRGYSQARGSSLRPRRAWGPACSHRLRGTGEARLDLDRAIVKLIDAARRGQGAGSETSKKSVEPRNRPWLLLIEGAARIDASALAQAKSNGSSKAKTRLRKETAPRKILLPYGWPKTPAKGPQTGVEAGEDRPPFPGCRRPAIPAQVRALVFARARFRCEMPGCSERRMAVGARSGARR